ncbi:hypothetical protein evm_014721 [Chilo suppressalis]|nr:hypothetical protein evm_014721 [Chilo suppressalis]
MDEMDLPDSQPFFTEYAYENEDDGGGSQSLLSGPKKRRTTDLVDDLKKYSDAHILNSNTQAIKKNNESSNKKLNETKINAESEDVVSDTERQEEDVTNDNDEEIRTSGNQCIDCIFEKEIDKRNYYFGNLLIGELQFLAPCMRSEAYVNILKYIDSLKHKHRIRNINKHT